MAALLATLPGSLASGAEARFHITVLDDAGAPLPDIVAGARAKGQGGAAVTDANGSAVVTVDVPSGAELAVAWINAFDLLETLLPGDELERLSLRARSIGLGPPAERLIRLTPGVGDYTIELRYRALRLVRGVVTEQGNPVARFWEIGTPTSGLASPRTKPDGSFQLIDPVGSDVMMRMHPHDDTLPGRSIVVRVPAAAIGPNGDMGAIDVNATVAQTGTVVFHLTATPEQYQQVHAHFRDSFWGLALVSTDGRTVIALMSEADERIPGSDDRIPLNQSAVIPAGTYYFVPGTTFCWTWTQRRIIEACLNGADLSQSGIPQVVIAPGANPDINLDPVAAELAIQHFFLPPN